MAHQPSRRGLAAATRYVAAAKPRFSCHWNGGHGRWIAPPDRPAGAPVPGGDERSELRELYLMRIAITIALASAVVVRGCAIRYDATGVSRVGVGLVGLRRSTGRELEPRLAAPRRSRTARRARAPSCRRAASRRSGRVAIWARRPPQAIPRKRGATGALAYPTRRMVDDRG